MATKARVRAWAGWMVVTFLARKDVSLYELVCMLNESIDLGDTGRATSIMKRRAKKKKKKETSISRNAGRGRFLSFQSPLPSLQTAKFVYCRAFDQCHSGLDNYLNGFAANSPPFPLRPAPPPPIILSLAVLFFFFYFFYFSFELVTL